MTACTSLQTLSVLPGSARPIEPPLRPNDEITVSLRTGEQLTLVVTSVSADWIEGRPIGSRSVARGPLAEVTQLQRRELDGPKSILLAIGILGALLIVGRAWGSGAADNIVGK
jgi:hypothetical protein